MAKKLFSLGADYDMVLSASGLSKEELDKLLLKNLN
jgi:hypothetical protein